MTCYDVAMGMLWPYGEEKSPLWLDAEVLRKSVRSQLDKVFPGHPYPEPFSVYEPDKLEEPAWSLAPPKTAAKGKAGAGAVSGGGDELYYYIDLEVR